MTNLIDWRKSSYSFEHGECVEVAAWHKSSHSAEDECVEVGVWTKSPYSYETGACVEVCAQHTYIHDAPLMNVGMRDTTQRELGHLEFSALSFAGLLGALK